MDVIGNNIANVNTAGYKTARVIFQDIFSQNIADGMANQDTIGGTNPMQVGLGIRLSTVDIIHSRATFQRTDKETDMMINGDGFFVVGQENPETGQYETFYTRAGNFDLDNEGYLVTSNGFYVMGRTFELSMGVISPGNEVEHSRGMIAAGRFPLNPTTNNTLPLNAASPNGNFRVGDIIPAGTFTQQAAGGALEGVTEVTAANLALWNSTVLTFVSTGAGTDADPYVIAQAWPPAGGSGLPSVTYVPARAPVFGLKASETYMTGNEQGLSRIRAVTERTRLPMDPETRLPTGVPPRPVGMNDDDYTALLENWIADMDAQFGREEVGLPGLGVADNGDISVIVGNLKLVIGRIAVAMFANPAGLEAAGNSLYRQTASSGEVVITEAFADGAGKIEGGGLEMSNVDLANEFTDMIVTQRGFQANSRIISVTDSMLEELVNLKR